MPVQQVFKAFTHVGRQELVLKVAAAHGLEAEIATVAGRFQYPNLLLCAGGLCLVHVCVINRGEAAGVGMPDAASHQGAGQRGLPTGPRGPRQLVLNRQHHRSARLSPREARLVLAHGDQMPQGAPDPHKDRGHG